MKTMSYVFSEIMKAVLLLLILFGVNPEWPTTTIVGTCLFAVFMVGMTISFSTTGDCQKNRDMKEMGDSIKKLKELVEEKRNV
jgi:hypothetical protein